MNFPAAGVFKISFALLLAAGALQTHADNYYEVLGVQLQSSFKQIKISYEKKIKKFESHRTSKNTSQIIKIKEAYDVLSDPESRTLYNELLRLKNLNFYERLGLLPSASMEEIKRSYQRLAMKFHPDRFNTNEAMANTANEIFKEISIAYDTLNHPGKKSVYDVRLSKRVGSYEEKLKPSTAFWTTENIASNAIGTAFGTGAIFSLTGIVQSDSDLLLTGLTLLAVGTGGYLCAKAFLSKKQKEKSK